MPYARLHLVDSLLAPPRCFAVLGWPHGPLREHPHHPGDGVVRHCVAADTTATARPGGGSTLAAG